MIVAGIGGLSAAGLDLTIFAVVGGAIGLGIGLLSTLPLSILIRSLMEGVSTVEWNTVFLAGAILFGVVLLASVVSASKAASVDPVQTLKNE